MRNYKNWKYGEGRMKGTCMLEGILLLIFPMKRNMK